MATTADRPLDIERQLWQAADTLRGSMDASEYKHVVLGLLFLKYISDVFDELHAELEQEPGADPEDRDEYLAETVFWVPIAARWRNLRDNARQPTIGVLIDEAMGAIEADNASLRGVLPRDYAREALDKTRLGTLVDLVSNITVGDRAARASDVLGRVYEYFLGRFAALEGRRGGEFYTAASVVRLLVEMIEPFKGRVFDPCCGSGGMFVQSEKFVEEHGGNRTDISVYGQESNNTTWRLCKMNLAIRGVESNILWNSEGSFLNDAHPDLKADYILANPPFNMSDWGGDRLRNDVRWKYGVPSVGNANYAWIQHFIHHLSNNGTAGFVMSNGSLSSNTSGEGDIRKGIIEDDLVDCIVALPGQLFFTTPIQVSLWFVTRCKPDVGKRDRARGTLFIDARQMGEMADRTHRVLTDSDISKITDTYHAWRGEEVSAHYEDVAGFCFNASLDDIRKNEHVLNPGRYVGIADEEDDGEPFEEKMQRLISTLREQQNEAANLDATIIANLKEFGDVK